MTHSVLAERIVGYCHIIDTVTMSNPIQSVVLVNALILDGHGSGSLAGGSYWCEDCVRSQQNDGYAAYVSKVSVLLVRGCRDLTQP